MSTWMKLSALFRGQTRRSAERITDHHALLILEQEIHDAEAGLHEARHHLSQMIAQRVQLERDRDNRRNRLQEREQQTLSALRQGNDSLASEIASAMARLEQQLKDDEKQIRRLAEQEQRLRQRLSESAQLIQEYRRELALLRATDSAQRASVLVNARGQQVENQLTAMQTSVERIRARQVTHDDEQEAWASLQEGCENTLDHQIAAAGLNGPSASEIILQRLREKL